MLNKIYAKPFAIKRHATAPLLNERLKYLKYWIDCGANNNHLQQIATFLLVIMDTLNFYQLRIISSNEINQGAKRWPRQVVRWHFIRHATEWLKIIGCLEIPVNKPSLFERYLTQYILYLQEEKGLSKNTIRHNEFVLKKFLSDIRKLVTTLKQLSPSLIDEALLK